MVKVEVEGRGFWKIKELLSKQVAEKILEESQKNIKEMKIIASGQLLQSGHLEKVGHIYYVVYDAPYAPYVEFGTRPHMPPVEPLIQWAKVKFGMSDEEARKFAWRVAKKIAEEGTKPHPFLRNAIDKVKDDIRLKRFRWEGVKNGSD